MMKPVAVLGAGPAGLMSAHALAMNGYPIALFTLPDAEGNPLKSKLGGAQFLHAPIPGINGDPDAEITYRVTGDPSTYQRKVYGDDLTIPFVSMSGIVDGQTQKAWNLIATYEALWEQLSVDRANCETINPRWLISAMEQEWFSGVVSSLPAPVMCLAHAGMRTDVTHTFVSQHVLIDTECILDVPDNTVVYDGTEDRSWYRCSKIFGVGGTEWSALAPPPLMQNLIHARKPLRTNCDCFEDYLLRVGRFGEWTKGVLTHHAYEATDQWVNQ